jgi:hypothetical protein
LTTWKYWVTITDKAPSGPFYGLAEGKTGSGNDGILNRQYFDSPDSSGNPCSVSSDRQEQSFFDKDQAVRRQDEG